MKTKLRDRREIAFFLKNHRQMQDMTQEELAKLLGVTRTAVCYYEAGTKMPNDKKKVALANIFGVSIMDLFFTEEE